MEKCQGTALCAAVEEIARHCASSALLLIIQAVGSFPIVHGASEEVRHRVLTRIAEERALVGYLVTEPASGSDVASIKTVATRDGNDYVISGTKCFATNRCRLYIPCWRAHPGRRTRRPPFCRRTERPGVSMADGKQARAAGSNTTEVILDEVRCLYTEPSWRGRKGFLLAMKDFDMSRPAGGGSGARYAEGLSR
jgi:cyclohexane-1-carbonyl-CoA dehydrogenase